MTKTEIDESIKEQMKACIVEKKNPSKCIKDLMESNNIPLEKENDILISIIKNGVEAEGGDTLGKAAHR